MMADSSRLRLKCDGTSAETTFHISAKRTSPFKSERASVQSTTGSRGVRIGGSNVGYTMFRSSVKITGYPLQAAVTDSKKEGGKVTGRLGAVGGVDTGGILDVSSLD